MKVYAYRRHRYEDLGSKGLYVFPEGRWVDVPDTVGRKVVNAHPDKLVDISNEGDPDDAVRRLQNPEPEAPYYTRRKPKR